MSSKFDKWKTLNDTMCRIQRWRGFLGKKYHGGGGGTGRVATVKISEVDIYYQECDGDQNYHEAEDELLMYLERVILKNAETLIDQAIKLAKEDLQVAAREALEERDEH